MKSVHTQSMDLDFTGQDIYIGLDTHEKSWKVAIYTQYFEHKVFSQEPDAGQLSRYLHRMFPGGRYQAVYEAGCFGFWIQRELEAAGIPCIVIHPGDVPTSDKEHRRKSDRIDARKLAVSLRAGQLRPIYIPPQRIGDDRILVRTRAQLVKEQTRLKNQITSLLRLQGVRVPREVGQYWSGRFLKWLSQVQIGEATARESLRTLLEVLLELKAHQTRLTRQIRTLAAQDPYRPWAELLVSVPGLSVLGAMTLLVELVDIQRFKGLDQLASYFGLVPDQHASGQTHYTGGITRRAHQGLKSLIIEASWVAVRKDPILLADFTRLAGHMRKQQAIIRIARKLLARIRYVWLHQQAYQLLQN